jgi:hypothetical protein
VPPGPHLSLNVPNGPGTPSLRIHLPAKEQKSLSSGGNTVSHSDCSANLRKLLAGGEQGSACSSSLLALSPWLWTLSLPFPISLRKLHQELADDFRVTPHGHTWYYRHREKGKVEGQ